MAAPVRVRFAPSPTGHLHIGSARTALFNWLLARHEGGAFLLRIEDTDRERSRREYLQTVLEDLRWLGLDWDEGPDKGGAFGPYFQSERLPVYNQYAAELVRDGKAYACYCTAEELAKRREQAQAEKKSPGYPGTCRNLTDREKGDFEREGRKPVIRFRLPESVTLTVHDAVRGRVDFSTEDLEDFVILKSDRFPVYNFACVVDDHLMKISHVLRGEEHLSNTPRQLLLYRAFGWEPPVFGHLSIILDERRKKLSKREGATYLGEFRKAGFLPETLLNFLSLLGWAPGGDLELMSLSEIVERFGFDGIGKSPAVFDFKKLEWMNGQYIRQLPVEALAGRLVPFLEEAGFLKGPVSVGTERLLTGLASLFRERLKTLRALPRETAYFFTEDYPVEEGAASKALTPASVSLVRGLFPRLKDAPFSPSELEALVRGFAEENGVKASDVIHPIRFMLTGKSASPGIFDIMAILGKETVLRRLERALEATPGALDSGGLSLKNPT